MLKLQEIRFTLILNFLYSIPIVEEDTGEAGRTLTTVFCGSG
jgi:hypothetical protein